MKKNYHLICKRINNVVSLIPVIFFREFEWSIKSPLERSDFCSISEYKNVTAHKTVVSIRHKIPVCEKVTRHVFKITKFYAIRSNPGGIFYELIK